MDSFSVSTTMLLAAACGASASAQCQYEVTWEEPFDCGLWGTEPYAAMGINNLGGWAGYRWECFPSDTFLPVYCPVGGTPQTLSMPPGASAWGARAMAVNDTGVAVGFHRPNQSGSAEIGCIWWPDGNVAIIEPAPGATTSRANDINIGNVVVGSTGGSPYVFKDGVMTVLPLFGGFAYSVSNSDFVAGTFVQAPRAQGSPWRDRAFRWYDGTVTVLEPVEPHADCAGFAVNNAGLVVGHSQTYLGGAGYASTPTLWIDGTAVALPLPAGYAVGSARSINDAGNIVGTARLTSASSGTDVAVIWINGQVHFVNDLTVPGSFPISGIVDLNEAGQFASSWQVVLASPVVRSLGDLNGDCAVDGSDLVIVLSEWGPRDWSVADINTDGVVGGNDLVVVLGHWTGS